MTIALLAISIILLTTSCMMCLRTDKKIAVADGRLNALFTIIDKRLDEVSPDDKRALLGPYRSVAGRQLANVDVELQTALDEAVAESAARYRHALEAIIEMHTSDHDCRRVAARALRKKEG